MANKNIKIKIEGNSSLNYVYQQSEALIKKRTFSSKTNAFSFLRAVEIVNSSEEDIVDAVVHFTSEPSWISFDDVNISCLEKNKTTIIDNFISHIDLLALYQVKEAVDANLTIRILNHDGDVLYTKSKAFKILPLEQSANGDIDETLACFVRPYDSEVLNVVENAKSYLKKKYDVESFAGYQYHDPNKVVEQLDALTSTIKALNFNYSEPPANFSRIFERIHLFQAMFEERTATSLDLALLLASVLENVGLRPLLTRMDNHILVGVFLDDEISLLPKEENASILLNQASRGFNHLLLLDARDLASGGLSSLTSMSEKAYQTLRDEKGFQYALDILSCRKEGLYPIPSLSHDGAIDFSFLEEESNTENLTIDLEDRRYIDEHKTSHANRFDYWEEKLLDLNLRNRLISLPFTSSGLQLLVSDAELFLKTLSAREKVTLVRTSLGVSGSEPEKRGPWDFPRSIYSKECQEAYRKGIIPLIARGQTDTDEWLKSLARRANTAIEESGCNPLFLTLGLIKWYDNEKAATHGTGAMYAPIFLLPVKMPRRRLGNNFVIDYSFDDLQLNTTCFEYFRQVHGLDFTPLIGGLPMLNDGTIDLRLIYNTIRQIIARKKNWVLIEETSVLSLFSFAHFVMWNDIKTRREELLRNKVVLSLVDGQLEWTPNTSLAKPEEFDEKLFPTSLAIPLPADSSQIKAIQDATEGESFILDGPPGTGKSQTIANMIVNFLYHGKTILFVAEKEVALDVVKKRLSDLGLGDFCLEIANPNAIKSQILLQIGRLLELGPTKEASKYEETADQILEKRRKLNSILADLHEKGSFYCSPYEAILKYLATNIEKGKLVVTPEYARNLNEEMHREAIEDLKEIVRCDSLVGGYRTSPFAPFTSRNYSMDLRDRLLTRLQEDIPLYEEAYRARYNLFLKKNVVSFSRQDSFLLADLLILFRDHPDIIPEFLGDQMVEERHEEIKRYAEDLKIYWEKRELLLREFSETILDEDGEALRSRYLDAQALPFFAKRKLLKTVTLPFKNALHSGIKWHKDLMPSRLEWLADYSAANHRLKNYISSISELFKERMPHGHEDALHLESALEATLKANNLLLKLTLLPKTSKRTLIAQFKSFLKNKDELYDQSINGYLEIIEKVKGEEQILKNEYSFDVELYPPLADAFKGIAQKFQAALAMGGSLADWVKLLNALDKAGKEVPSALLNSYKEGNILPNKLIASYECGLSYEVLALSLEEKQLNGLNGDDTDKIIKKYGDLVEEFSRLTVIETVSRVTTKFPASDANYAQSTAMYQLRKLAKNGGRGVSLRSIFEQYGDLIHTLCPCFLMSPIAVAQFLKPEAHLFDMVIFDEASQIPTSEAVGAIARGKACIIAGDQQQMPPSNYFASTISLQGDDYVPFLSLEEDLESLLDDAIVIGFPRKRLTWHYRSKHESLIAFSNRKFYDNSLLTFPSPGEERSAVSFRNVGGLYEKGRAINRVEAKAIVDEILKRLKDPLLSKKSIGVVTFNEAQQNLVEDLLDRAFARNSNLNSNPGGESIFVKNLENVQGDERDVILFSICYAPEVKGGKLALNFGPLSREKGERRLNVAVSRAREEMIVFSSIEPQDVRAERAKNAGASYLRDFLTFAKEGVDSLPNYVGASLKKPQLSVASFLANDLRKLGYQVDVGIGASTLKIDLAIRSPEDPNRYILGLLMDGDSYTSCATCRDRNLGQPETLRRLGWNLLRIWSVEYLDHPVATCKKIVNVINECLAGRYQLEEEMTNDDFAGEVSFEKKKVEMRPHAIYYSREPLLSARKFENSEFERNFLANHFTSIIKAEAPISRHLLETRFKEIYNLTRMTASVKSLFNQALEMISYYVEMCGGEEFYWPSALEAFSYRFYRLPNPNVPRALEDISYIEIGNAFADVLETQGMMSMEDLFKQTSLIFGYGVLSEKARLTLGKALTANAGKRLGIEALPDGLIRIVHE